MADKLKIPAVEVGLIVENLDPEKTYVFEQYNPAFGLVEEARAAQEDGEKESTTNPPLAEYVEGRGWRGLVNLTKEEFKKSVEDLANHPEAGKENPYKDRTDVVVLWFLAAENSTVHASLKEYGAEEPLFKLKIDATGLTIKAGEE